MEMWKKNSKIYKLQLHFLKMSRDEYYNKKLKDANFWTRQNKYITWGGRIAGPGVFALGLLIGNYFTMLCGAGVCFGAYVLHPYKEIQKGLEEEIKGLEKIINQ
jgi:hypothetical protein